MVWTNVYASYWRYNQVDYEDKILHKIVATKNCCGCIWSCFLQCDLVESMGTCWKEYNIAITTVHNLVYAVKLRTKREHHMYLVCREREHRMYLVCSVLDLSEIQATKNCNMLQIIASHRKDINCLFVDDAMMCLHWNMAANPLHLELWNRCIPHIRDCENHFDVRFLNFFLWCCSTFKTFGLLLCALGK